MFGQAYYLFSDAAAFVISYLEISDTACSSSACAEGTRPRLFLEVIFMTNNTATIADAEARISRGLTRLRVLAIADPDALYAVSMLAPSGHRTVVQLEEDGRKKRNTASASNWNPKTGEMLVYFEPEEDENDLAPVIEPDPAPHTSPQATFGRTPDTQVRECCMALSEAEKQGKPFIGLKWFRDTALPQQSFEWAASPQERFRVLNQAIAEGLIETQSLANPMNPAHPTTTLRLNREKTRGIVGSRFNPIPLRGEPLSSMIIRERGER